MQILEILEVPENPRKYVALDRTRTFYIGRAQNREDAAKHYSYYRPQLCYVSRAQLRRFLSSRKSAAILCGYCVAKSPSRTEQCFRIGCCIFEGENYTRLVCWIRGTKKKSAKK